MNDIYYDLYLKLLVCMCIYYALDKKFFVIHHTNIGVILEEEELFVLFLVFVALSSLILKI